MQIAVLLFDRMTALDAIGPYEVLSRLPGAELRFVAPAAGEVRTDVGLGLVADHALADVTAPDLLLVPGGPGTRGLEHDEALLSWLRTAHQSTRWTCSVCTGSLLLAAAGLLAGQPATTHWSQLERLAEYGAVPTAERVVRAGKIVTAAGVSAGIDLALTLTALIGGELLAQTIQLGIEYDPAPPFDAGSPAKAPEAVVQLLRSYYAKRG